GRNSLAEGDGGNAQTGGPERRADRARDVGKLADVLSQVDPRNDELGWRRQVVQDGEERAVGGKARDALCRKTRGRGRHPYVNRGRAVLIAGPAAVAVRGDNNQIQCWI